MPKFLGIDYGLERTGLAVTDLEGKIVFPLLTLHLRQFVNRSELFNGLAALALKHNIEAIVLGLPVDINGNETLSCRQVRNAATKIKRRLPLLPIYFMPELLSSHEATQDLIDGGISGKKLKKYLDQQAACRILSSFLAQPPERRLLA